MSAADKGLPILSDAIALKIAIMWELTTHILTTYIVYFACHMCMWQVRESSLGRQ